MTIQYEKRADGSHLGVRTRPVFVLPNPFIATGRPTGIYPLKPGLRGVIPDFAGDHPEISRQAIDFKSLFG